MDNIKDLIIGFIDAHSSRKAYESDIRVYLNYNTEYTRQEVTEALKKLEKENIIVKEYVSYKLV